MKLQAGSKEKDSYNSWPRSLQNVFYNLRKIEGLRVRCLGTLREKKDRKRGIEDLLNELREECIVKPP